MMKISDQLTRSYIAEKYLKIEAEFENVKPPTGFGGLGREILL